MPNVTADQADRVTPNSSSSQGPNVTNSACAADIRPNIAGDRQPAAAAAAGG